MNWGLYLGLLGLAGVASAQGQAARAARLFGAAGGDPPPIPAHRHEWERNMAAVRAQLDEEAFAAAWAEGRAMALEQAIAYALRQAS